MYKRKDMPREEDLVVCKVEKINHAALFVDLVEYDNVKGIIRIDEVAAGRIRSIRDYVKEGMLVVCKVLKAYPENRTVDVSLRRVSAGLKKAKMDEYKKEKIATKILEAFAEKEGIPKKEIYDKIIYPIVEKFDLLYPYLQRIVIEGEHLLDVLDLKPDIKKRLYQFLKQKIKPPKYTKKITLELISLDPKGVYIIKNILKDLKNLGIQIRYKAAPEYDIIIESYDPKKIRDIEEKMKEILKKYEKSGKIIFEIKEK